MAPAGRDRRREDPLGRLLQRRVSVLDEAGELRTRGLEHDQVLDPGDHPLAVGVAHRRRRAQFRAGAHERVRVRAAVDLDPLPARRLDVHARAVDRLERGDEVARQAQRELLDLPHRLLPGEREHGVLLRVGRHDVGVVAGDVDVLQIAGERDPDVEVAEPVLGCGPVDGDHPDLRLAVLVGSDPHAHAGQRISAPDHCTGSAGRCRFVQKAIVARAAGASIGSLDRALSLMIGERPHRDRALPHRDLRRRRHRIRRRPPRLRRPADRRRRAGPGPGAGRATAGVIDGGGLPAHPGAGQHPPPPVPVGHPRHRPGRDAVRLADDAVPDLGRARRGDRPRRRRRQPRLAGADSGCTTSSDHHYVFPERRRRSAGGRDRRRAADRVRFHPARGSMDLGQSDGGLPPDSVVEDRDAILAATAAAIDRWHDPSRGLAAADRRRPLLAVQRHRRADARGRRARPRRGRAPAHPPGRDRRRGGVLPRALRLHAGRVRRASSAGSATTSGWRTASTSTTRRSSASRATGTGVAHCPTSNGRLGLGRRPDRAAAESAGVPVGLGVDGAASNESGRMVDELHQALLVARLRDGPLALTAREALAMAHARRRALPRPRRASSARSSPASSPTWRSGASTGSPATGSRTRSCTLVFGAPTLDRLFVGGRPIVADGRLLDRRRATRWPAPRPQAAARCGRARPRPDRDGSRIRRGARAADRGVARRWRAGRRLAGRRHLAVLRAAARLRRLLDLSAFGWPPLTATGRAGDRGDLHAGPAGAPGRPSGLAGGRPGPRVLRGAARARSRSGTRRPSAATSASRCPPAR